MRGQRDGLAVERDANRGRLADEEPEACTVHALDLAGLQRRLEQDRAGRRPAPHLDVRARAHAGQLQPARNDRCDRSLPLRDDRRRSGVAAAELPGDDHKRRQRGDSGKREQQDLALDPAVLVHARRAARYRLVEGVAADVAGAVLVDVELTVETEVLRVRAQEALDVRLSRQHAELLVLERPQVFRADLRRELDLRPVELLPDAGLAEAVADLEHGLIVEALFSRRFWRDGARRRGARRPARPDGQLLFRQSLLVFEPQEELVEPDRDGAGERDADPGDAEEAARPRPAGAAGPLERRADPPPRAACEEERRDAG